MSTKKREDMVVGVGVGYHEVRLMEYMQLAISSTLQLHCVSEHTYISRDPTFYTVVTKLHRSTIFPHHEVGSLAYQNPPTPRPHPQPSNTVLPMQLAPAHRIPNSPASPNHPPQQVRFAFASDVARRRSDFGAGKGVFSYGC